MSNGNLRKKASPPSVRRDDAEFVPLIKVGRYSILSNFVLGLNLSDRSRQGRVRSNFDQHIDLGKFWSGSNGLHGLIEKNMVQKIGTSVDLVEDGLFRQDRVSDRRQHLSVY